MRAYLLSLVLIAFYINGFSQACCCTGAGANYSILPNIDKHIVGLRYSYTSYNTTAFNMSGMNMNGMDMTMMGPGTPAHDNVHSVDAFGRFNLTKQLQVSAFIPVHILNEVSAVSNQRTAGLGDVSLLLQYALFNTQKCNGHVGKSQVRLGAGVKLPTGKFSMTPDGMFATDLQLGTGSVDLLFNTIYTYRYKQIGFNLVASYKKNLANADQFRFGDKMKAGGNVFYVWKLPKDVSLMPLLGADYDYAFSNFYKASKLTYTGGQYLSANIGFDIYYKQFAISTSVSPVLMSVSNWSGEPYPLWHFETGVYYNFSINFKNKKSVTNGTQKSL